jgi:hypothetical protein
VFVSFSAVWFSLGIASLRSALRQVWIHFFRRLHPPLQSGIANNGIVFFVPTRRIFARRAHQQWLHIIPVAIFDWRHW